MDLDQTPISDLPANAGSFVWDQEAAGSNPVAPIRENKGEASQGAATRETTGLHRGLYRHKTRADRLAGLFEPATVVLFAGMGGVCIGVERAYVRGGFRDKYIDLAVNHWTTAVGVHELNHPMTEHLRADVLEVDPATVLPGRRIAYLHASPDCRDFSKAKGSRPKEKHIRALAWVVVDWAAKRRPDVITLENVEEFRQWGPLARNGQPCKRRRGRTFDQWCEALRTLGYEVEARELRACDYGAPTTRKRLFVIARCDGKPIIWPEATHGQLQAKAGSGRTASGNSSVASATRLARARAARLGAGDGGGGPGHRSRRVPLLKPYRTAAECIDWSIPRLSVFATRGEAKAWSAALNVGKERHERVGIPQRPLRLKTDQRLARGLLKFVLDSAKPFIVDIQNYGWNSSQVRDVDQPMPTVTAGPRGGGHAAVNGQVAPFGGPEHRCTDLRDPAGTIVGANEARGVVAAHLTAYHHSKGEETRGQTPAEPIRTLDTQPRFGLVATELAAYTIPRLGEREGQAPRCRSIEEPAPVVTGKGEGASLVVAHLTKHYGGVVGKPLDVPADTVTGVDHSLSAPHLLKFRGESPGTAADAPVDTITAGSNHSRPAGAGHAMGLSCAYLSHFYTSNTSGGEGDPRRPAKTITSGGQHATVLAAFLTTYYGEGSGLTGTSAEGPMPTLTSRDRVSIVWVKGSGGWPLTDHQLRRAKQVARFARRHLGAAVDRHLVWVRDEERGTSFPLVYLWHNGSPYLLTDLLMRMLRPRELARAQGFPDCYIIDRTSDGTRISNADQVKLIGNSVPPQFAEALAYENVVKLGVMKPSPAREAVSA
jgi:DNA (cytosine-5)-methyltransferase 1